MKQKGYAALYIMLLLALELLFLNSFFKTWFYIKSTTLIEIDFLHIYFYIIKVSMHDMHKKSIAKKIPISDACRLIYLKSFIFF